MKKDVKPPLIIGLVGEAGSGKDTVASYIKKKYQAEEFRFSYMLVNALKILDIPISRANLAWFMNILKRKFGSDVLTKAMKKTMRELARKPIIVINGIRLPSDYDFIRKQRRNKIIYVTAPARLRWQRVLKRGEKKDDEVSFREFLKLNAGENERYIRCFGRKADYKIENLGGLPELKDKIDETIKKI
ncbi:MAG: hypothetical protein FJZ04_03290 [Candidatus Moranbacteria bacterium]|nr:hypothetical protein [Candidatus Moranbacteria bacterium]